MVYLYSKPDDNIDGVNVHEANKDLIDMHFKHELNVKHFKIEGSLNDWIFDETHPDYIIVQSFKKFELKGIDYNKQMQFPVFDDVTFIPKDYIIVFPKFRIEADFSINYHFEQLKFDISSLFVNKQCSGTIDLQNKKISSSTVEYFTTIPSECRIDMLLNTFISNQEDIDLNCLLLE